MSEELFIKTEDGTGLHLFGEPTLQSRGTVLLCHGLTADLHEGGFFDQFSASLQKANLSVVRFDFRGHGKSTGSSLDVTLSGEAMDAETVCTWLSSNRYRHQSLFVIGASFCCHSVIKLAQNRKLAGLVLLNPVFDYQRTFTTPEAPWGQEILATRGDAQLPPNAYAMIPGSQFYFSKQLWSEMETDRTPRVAATLTCPIIAFHGDQDVKVPPQPIIDFAAQHPEIVDLHIRRDEGHGLKKDREELINSVTAWLVNHLD